MTRTVSKAAGRWTLMLLVFGSALLAVVTLLYLGRGGRIYEETLTASVKQLVEMYLPLLGVMAGFYFAEYKTAAREPRPVSVEVFVFATLLTVVWVVSPIVILLVTQYVEDAMSRIALFTPVGQTVVAGAVAFYFSKSA